MRREPTASKIGSTLLLLGVSVALAGPARAQQALKMPEASPAAAVSQTIGLTKIDVAYHRPAVNKRKVFGALVPYGEVWRAGANENSTITFSTPVQIGGKSLPAGTYGIQMIPTAKQWTVIFSHMSVAWGHFGYDPKEDALRVSVTPQPADFEERLSYRFDDPTESATTMALHWEKLKVPVKIEVDTPAVVMASMRAELRGLAQFNWQPWSQAARYWLDHGGNLDEAQKMSERSLTMGENFQNLRTRAAIAEKRGDKTLATQLTDKAMGMATEIDLNQYGYVLLFGKKVDEAIAIFQKNVQAHPQSWNAYDSLAEAYLTKNDVKGATENYGKALTLVKDEPNKKRIVATLARLKDAK